MVLCTAVLNEEEFLVLQREFLDSLTSLMHSAIKSNRGSSVDSKPPTNLSKSYMKCVCFTSYTWLLDCISNYNFIPLE